MNYREGDRISDGREDSYLVLGRHPRGWPEWKRVPSRRWQIALIWQRCFDPRRVKRYRVSKRTR